MNNRNIMSNKFDLNWSTMFSYRLVNWRFNPKTEARALEPYSQQFIFFIIYEWVQ